MKSTVPPLNDQRRVPGRDTLCGLVLTSKFSCRVATVSGLLLVASCGGGRVDRGFEGELQSVSEQPSPNSGSPREDTTPPRTGVPALVIIRSDSCKPCRRMELVLYPAYEPFKSKVELFVLDVSDDAHEAASRERARELGVEDFFEKYRGITPSIAILTKHGGLTHYTGNTFGRRSWERTIEAMIEDAR